MLIGVYAMSRLQWGTKKGGKSRAESDILKVDVYAKSNALLSDVIINYRTVICLGEKNVDALVKKFEQLLEEPSKKKVRNAHCGGFFFGYSNCARMLFLGLVFYIGSKRVQVQGDQSDDIFLSIYILFSTCMGSGIALSNMPSVQKAKQAAKNIFEIVDEPSTLDVRKHDSSKKTVVASGEIEFQNVMFRYPSRE